MAGKCIMGISSVGLLCTARTGWSLQKPFSSPTTCRQSTPWMTWWQRSGNPFFVTLLNFSRNPTGKSKCILLLPLRWRRISRRQAGCQNATWSQAWSLWSPWPFCAAPCRIVSAANPGLACWDCWQWPLLPWLLLGSSISLVGNTIPPSWESPSSC